MTLLAGNLSQIRALITRPEGTDISLIKKIQTYGGTAYSLPMLSIKPLNISQKQLQTLSPLQNFKHIIVTSIHAAAFSAQYLKNHISLISKNTTWYPIGQKTADAITKYIQPPDLTFKINKIGKNHTSESLLALDCLQQVREEPILLIKGQGGRRLIANTLSQRGAIVTVISVYQRIPLRYNTKKIEQVFKKHRINVILCHSGSAITNLLENIPPKFLESCSIIVPSERVKHMAAKCMNLTILNAGSADDDSMIETLTKYWEN